MVWDPDRDEQIRNDEAAARRMSMELNQGGNNQPFFAQGPVPVGNDQRIVQRNLARGLAEARNQSSRILSLMICMAGVELLAAAIIIGLSWGTPADQPLIYWLIIHETRWLINLPIEISRYRMSRDGEDVTFLDDMRSFSGMLYFVWVIFGARFLYQTTFADPLLFYGCLTLVVLSVIWTMLPLLFCLGVCICLPCILMWMRYLAEPEGASSEIIKTLNERKITKKETHSQCTICLENYKENDMARKLPCGHEFHSDCVDVWLRIKGSCPLCRTDIRGKSEEEARAGEVAPNDPVV